MKRATSPRPLRAAPGPLEAEALRWKQDERWEVQLRSKDPRRIPLRPEEERMGLRREALKGAAFRSDVREKVELRPVAPKGVEFRSDVAQ